MSFFTAHRARISRSLVTVFVLGFIQIIAAPILIPHIVSPKAEAVTDTYAPAQATSWTVPANVTSIQVTLKGGSAGVGGTDCGNECSSDAGGPRGVLTYTFNVSVGDLIGIYPGNKGVDGTSTRVGGADTTILGTFDGGDGGLIGTYGGSGQGGGGGAASVLAINGVIRAVAGGAGGGGGAGNVAGSGFAGQNYDSSRVINNSYTGGTGTQPTPTTCAGGTQFENNTKRDGGGGGGGGGGWFAGTGGGVYLLGNGECAGYGGSRGGNYLKDNSNVETVGTAGSSETVAGTNGSIDITYTASSSFGSCSPNSTTDVDIYRVLKFTNTNTCTWTVPSGVTAIDFFMVGAGGGGGAGAGSGGSGGGSISRSAYKVIPGASLNLTVGIGGKGGIPSASKAGPGLSTTVEDNSSKFTSYGGGAGAQGPDRTNYPVGGSTSNGTTAIGLQGGAGGLSSDVGGNPTPGQRGSTNYFYGSENQYAGGGSGGSYPGSGGSIAAATSFYGGGSSGSAVSGTGTNGGDASANTGGGGGGGTSANTQTSGGRGADGVILIRYAINSADAFPSELSSALTYRYTADNYQAQAYVGKSWINSAGTTVPIGSADISGTPTIVTQGTTDSSYPVGSSKSLLTLQGASTAKVTLLSGSLSNYTMFHISRYRRGETTGRILTSTVDWISGQYNASWDGVAHHNVGWMTPSSATEYKWLLSTDQTKLYRANGTDVTYDGNYGYVSGATGPTNLGINVRSGEPSAWQMLDLIIFNRELTPAEIRTMERHLGRIYGLTLSSALTHSETDTAVTMDGNQYLRVQSLTSNIVNDTFTVEAWIKPGTVCGSGGGVRCTLYSRYYTAILTVYDGYFGFILYGTSTGWQWVDTTYKIPINEWHHIAFVKRGVANTNDGVDLYLDGQLVYTKKGSPYLTSTSAVSFNAADVIRQTTDQWTYLGTILDTGDRWRGSFDEVKVWKTARTASQIQSDMHSNETSSATLQEYWDFNSDFATSLVKIPNLATYSDGRSDMAPYSNLTITYTDVKTVTTSAAYTTITFPRSYITQFGGWRPTRTVNSSALIVGGGGGGGGGGYAGTGGGGGGGGSGGTYVGNVNITSSTTLPIRVGTGGVGGSGGISSGGWAGVTGGNGSNSIAFNTTVSGGNGGWGASLNSPSGYTDGTGGIGGASGNGFAGGTKRGTVGDGGAGGGGATQAGTNASSATGASGGSGLLNSYSGSEVTYSIGGSGGNGSTTNATGASGSVRAANLGHGGNGGTGSAGGTTGSGSQGSSGVVIVRWITATKPTYTAPTNVYLNAGMTETFTTNVSQDSATAQLTRTFRWESTTPTSAGVYSTVKQGTGAANAAFSWIPADTSTSGSGYLYRVVVTDSDTAGLYIQDTSTSVYAIINQPLNVSGTSSILKTINLAHNETFTITLGTPTYRASLFPVIPGITIDTSTAGYAVLKISDTATVGTWSETLTVTDSVSAVFNIPLTIKINAPPTLLNTSEIVSNGLILNLDAGNSRSIILGDNSSSAGVNWNDLSGNQKHAQTAATTSASSTFNSKTCTDPTYYSAHGGYLSFDGVGDCYWSPYIGYQLERSFTVEAWFRLDGDSFGASRAIITQNILANSNVNFSMGDFVGDGKIYVGFYDGTWKKCATGYTPIKGVWNHLVGTYDGSNIKFYINGGSAWCTTAHTGGLGTSINTTGTWIGRKWDAATYLNGSIATARVYNRALTQAEIQQNFDATKSRFNSSNLNMLKLNQKYGVLTLDSFTATLGGDTKTVTFSESPRQGVVWDTTSTPGQIKLSVGESLTVGTYYDTVTVTDNFGASTYLPLSFTVTKADTITVTSGPSLTTVYTGSAPTNGPIARITGLVGVDTATVNTAFSVTCALGGACSIGDLGPGGGRIFYISPTVINAASGVSDGGIYLEVAPRNWNGNESSESGSSFATKLDSVAGTSSAIGTGAENTRLLRNALGDSATAATLAMNRTFKGLSDWFVPSYNELTTAITTLAPLGLGEFTTYRNLWSSTQNPANSNQGYNAWSSNPPVLNTLLKTDNYFLRPIRAFSPLYPTETTTPVDVETYTAKGADITFQVGALSNYQAVIYETSTLKITQANQNKLSINLYGAIAGTPFLIQTSGGSGTGAVTETVTAGGSATNCTLSNHVLSNSSPSTAQVTCNIRVTKASSRNYFAESLDATVYFMLFVNNMPTNQIGSGSTIALNGATSLSIDDSATVRAPNITSISISGTTVTINGEGLGSAQVSIRFERNVITSATPTGTSSAGIITVTLPGSARSGYVHVTLPSGAVATSPYLTLP